VNNWHCDGILNESTSIDHGKSCLLAIPTKPFRDDFVYSTVNPVYITFVRATMWIGNEWRSKFAPVPTNASPALQQLFNTRQVQHLDHVIFDFGHSPGLMNSMYAADRDQIGVIVKMKGGPTLKPFDLSTKTSVLWSGIGADSVPYLNTETVSNLPCVWEMRLVSDGDYSNNVSLMEQHVAQSPTTFSPRFHTTGLTDMMGNPTTSDSDYSTEGDAVSGVYSLPTLSASSDLQPQGSGKAKCQPFVWSVSPCLNRL
jgi:hypothetical protein